MDIILYKELLLLLLLKVNNQVCKTSFRFPNHKKILLFL
nr:MAG TPA: hypothetical protein [Caudoviricetes sp.]